MSRDERDLDRREFLKTTSAIGVGAMAAARGLAPLQWRGRSPNEKVVVAVIGVNGRGVVHSQNFSAIENSEVAYICDVDTNVVAKGVAAARKNQKREAKLSAISAACSTIKRSMRFRSRRRTIGTRR
jgi:hypothetical protein